MADRQYSVMIARFPGNQSEMPTSTQWVLQTNLKLRDDPRVKQPVLNWWKSDTPITMVRNEAVRIALDQGIDYLLMIDSDMDPDLPYPEAKPFWDSSWDFMMKRRKVECEGWGVKGEEHPAGYPSSSTLHLPPATIAAPYCGPAPWENCFIFEWKSWETETPDANFRLEMIGRESAAIRAGFQEVAALPTGLILYDTRVFRVLDPPWFRYEYKDHYESEKYTTEDVYQTRNASMLKLPQYVNWDAWAGHCKLKTVKKPYILYPDQIHETLVKFARRRVNSDERLRFIDRSTDLPSPHAAVAAPNGNGQSLADPVAEDTGAI